MTLRRDVTGMMVSVIPKWLQVPAIFRLENYHYSATLYIYIYIYCMYISHTCNRQYAMINFAYVYYTYIYIYIHYTHNSEHILIFQTI